MNKEEILSICLEEIRSGKSTIEDCITRHPDMEAELRSLLEIAAALKPEAVKPSEEFKKRTLRRLFEEMHAPPEKVSHKWWSWQELTPARIIASVLAVLLILGAAGGSTAYAAQSSLPGDTLYPVKTTVENLQLALTTGDEAKAELHIKLAQKRIDEATQQARQNRNINVQALKTVEQQFDDAIKELNQSDDTEANNHVLSRMSAATLNQQLELEQVMADVPQVEHPALKQALEVTRRGNLIAQVAYSNHYFLERQPSVSDRTLDEHQFKVDGTLLSITGRTWNVGGVIIQNVYLQGKEPATGSHVKIEGLIKSNEAFISHITVSEESKPTTMVEGQFGGTNQNGTSNVGGISVEIKDITNAQLQPGDNVQLKGDYGDSQFSVTNRESERDENRDTTRLSGILTAVNVNSGTITLQSAGSQISVKVSEARIENAFGRALNLSDLNHLIGQQTYLDGLYKKDGFLFAQRVRVEGLTGPSGPSGEEPNQTPFDHDGHH